MHTPEAKLVMAASKVSDVAGSMRARLAQVVELVCDYLDASLGHVFLVHEDDDGRAVPTSIWVGDATGTDAFQREVESHTSVAGEGLAGRVMARGQLVVLEDLSREDPSKYTAGAIAAGLRSAVGVPLLAAESVVGGLEVYSRAAFDQQLEVIAPALDAVGHIAGRIVERARFERRADGARAKLAVAASLSRLGTFEVERDTCAFRPSRELCAVLSREPRSLPDVSALTDAVASRERRRLAAALLELCDRGGNFTMEDAVTDDTGAVRWFVVSARAVAGRIIGVVQDVSPLHEVRIQRDVAQHRVDELAALTSELARSNAELDRFAYIASHDLKAPLRGIANVAGWLSEDLDDQLDEESREHLSLLMGRVQRMERMIEGMLRYARAGRSAPPDHAEAADIIRKQVDLLAPPDTVTVLVSDTIPALRVVESPFAQVVRNLIGNAIRHGCPDGGRVEVRAEDLGDAVRFCVADDGVGIARRHQERIFEPFQTLQPRDTVDSTGIGLAMVKKIVEQRGGRVKVNSRPDAGSEFYFDWPKTQGRGGSDITPDQRITG